MNKFNIFSTYLNPVEIQYEDSGYFECSYRKECLSELIKEELYSILKENFNYDNIEMVSIYLDELVLVYRSKYSTSSNLLDYYAYKINLTSKTYYLKTYSKNIYKYTLPQLPKDSTIASQFGLGEYYTKDLLSIKDIYFFHSDPLLVCNYFNAVNLSKIEPTKDCLALFGLTFNCETLQILKIKRYIYPDDINIENPTYI